MKKHRQVTATSYAPKDRGRFPKTPKVFRIVTPLHFLWVFGLCVALASWKTAGTPHILFEYGYQPTSGVRTSCTYFGIHPQKSQPINGKCPLIRFFTSEN